jgi:7,8-dihydropterin-6-yl-methyl-4-(beta-D-ribofuranosyl)aminobenzene 5'-phosphate synthase
LELAVAGKIGSLGGMRIRFLGGCFLWLCVAVALSGAGEAGRVKTLKITVLSTMLADGKELGEWGFAALVEADGRRILFDTGQHTDVVLKNARSLGVDLSTVTEVVLSHSHSDHVGGFMTLRRAMAVKSPAALARTHVGEGMFFPRRAGVPRVEGNPMVAIRGEYVESGGAFTVHVKPAQLYPGVWLTGPVPRKYPERNWSGHDRVTTPAGTVEDNLPEDMALVIDTEQGLVVVTGCGHAGVVNTVDYARTVIRPARVHALIGGLHLFAAKEATLVWTAEKLRGFGVDHLIGAHCTGIETVFRLRTDLGLDRARAVVGAVGATFELGRGIDARNIAK